MANKKLLSIVAASALMATFALTGCGGGGSSSSTVEVKNITVSDGHALNATVTATDKTSAATQVGNGVYQFVAPVTGALTAANGVNDVNNNGVADAGEPFLPTFKAPANYSNINPFTTILVDGGLTVAQLATLVGVNATEVNNFDIDVVAKAKANPALAKKAALYTAIISQVNYDATHAASSSSVASSVASSTSSTGALPGPVDGSSSVSSSSVSSATTSSTGALPGPITSTILAKGDLPGPGSTETSSSSVASSVASSTSSTGDLPGPGDSSSSAATSTSSAASSTATAKTLVQVMAELNAGATVCTALPSLCALESLINTIPDATINVEGMKVLDEATRSTLAGHNGAFVASSSSVASSVSSVASSVSSVAASSASSDSDTPPSPGDIPGGSSSSTSSVASSSVSSTSTSTPSLPGPGSN